MQPRKLNQQITNATKNWTGVIWLIAHVVTLACLPSSSNCAANGSTFLQKNSTDAWYLPWQMANDSSLFLNSNSISVMKILWSNCHFPNVFAYTYVVFTNAECLLIVHDCLHVLKFPKTKNYIGSKFHGGNHPRKLNCLKILSTKYFSPENFHICSMCHCV